MLNSSLKALAKRKIVAASIASKSIPAAVTVAGHNICTSDVLNAKAADTIRRLYC